MKVGQINARLKKQSILMNKIQNELEGKKANVLEINDSGIYDTYGYSYVRVNSSEVKGTEREFLCFEDIQEGDLVSEVFGTSSGTISFNVPGSKEKIAFVSLSETRFCMIYGTRGSQLRAAILDINGFELTKVQDIIFDDSQNTNCVKAMLLSNGLILAVVGGSGAGVHGYLLSISENNITLVGSTSSALAYYGGEFDCVELTGGKVLLASQYSDTSIRITGVNYTSTSITKGNSYSINCTSVTKPPKCVKSADNAAHVIYIDDGVLKLAYSYITQAPVLHTIDNTYVWENFEISGGNYSTLISGVSDSDFYYIYIFAVGSSFQKRFITSSITQFYKLSLWGREKIDSDRYIDYFAYPGYPGYRYINTINIKDTWCSLEERKEVPSYSESTLSTYNTVAFNQTVGFFINVDIGKYILFYKNPCIKKSLSNENIIGVASETKSRGNKAKVIVKGE